MTKLLDTFLRSLNFAPHPPNPADEAKKYGYAGEVHNVTTPDGYILNVQRIHKKSVLQASEPFVLVHCLTCNSGIWVIQEPAKNIVFLLADAGYDVWIPTLRGSHTSRKHTKLSPSSYEFWDYDWHDHGVLDMPTIIDYILNETSSRQVYYLGYSMGTTTFFVMTSMLPEYNAKIKHMFALSPVGYCGKIRGAIRLFSSGISFFNPMLQILFRNHAPFEMNIVKAIKFLFIKYVSRRFCFFLVEAIMGYNPVRNEENYTKYVLYWPDAASAKELTHFAQLINNPNSFRLFDYGKDNWIKYNSSTPPDYPVDTITTPMTFFYSKNDALSASQDVEKFSKNFKNVTLIPVKDPNYNHLDFVLSASVNEQVNMPLLKILESQRT